MPRYRWVAQVTVDVDASWVADGFDLTSDRLRDVLEDNLLPYATGDERKVTARILRAPDALRIRKEQGE